MSVETGSKVLTCSNQVEHLVDLRKALFEGCRLDVLERWPTSYQGVCSEKVIAKVVLGKWSQELSLQKLNSQEE